MAVQQYLMMGKSAPGRKIITGERWVWGSNYAGTGGLGHDTGISLPLQVGSLTNWQNTDKIGGAKWSRASVKSDGTLWTWGNNGSGELGHGNTTALSSPVQVGSLTDWDNATVWSGTMGAVKTDGTLWTWGDNSAGQLGHGDTTARSSPTQVGSATDWIHVIDAEENWTVAMKTNGAIYWAGTDQTGGLGNQSTHIQVGSETGFVDVIGKFSQLVMWKEA